MRSMARLPDGSDQALVELKAVDGAYPLYGALATTPALPTAELFAERDGVFGAAAPDILFERLGLKIGDRIKVGSATFELRALLDNGAGRGLRRLRLRAAPAGFARCACGRPG